MTRYRSGDLGRRMLFLAELVGAAAAGVGLWLVVVLVLSLGTP